MKNVLPSEAKKAEESLIKTAKVPVKPANIRIGNYDINYITYGQGKPILLIHGATIGWGQWFKNIAELAKNFKVYAIDLPGSGLSTRINFATSNLETAWVKTVEEFIKALNLKSVSIIGHSFGGWIGIKIAARLPSKINKLILVNSIGIEKNVPLKHRLLAIPLFAHLVSSLTLGPNKEHTEKFLLSVISRPDFKYDSSFVDYVHTTRLLLGSQSLFLLINRTVNLAGLRKEFLLTEQLQKINSPTLIIWGDNDPTLPTSTAKKAKKLIPISQLHLYPNVGHVPNLEESDRFNADVIKFLKTK